jgi:hypothetical protein
VSIERRVAAMAAFDDIGDVPEEFGRLGHVDLAFQSVTRRVAPTVRGVPIWPP